MNEKTSNYKKTGIPLFAVIYLAQLFSLSQSALAMPNGGELVKYFNPVHEKSYLNEKQDRLIKKKSFKITEIPGMEPVPNKDIGLFASIDLSQLKDMNYIDQLLAKPEVNGLSCILPWRALEPDEETYEWQITDALLAACAKHNKQLILRVSTCGLDEVLPTSAASKTPRSDTPDWVFDAAVPSITYKGKDGQDHLMPIFWDGTYLAKWSNFVNELGKRYDKNQHIHSIGITGGGLLGSTSVIPNFQHDKDTANATYEKLQKDHGMSPRQLVSHWKYVADVFPRAFSKQHLNLDIDPPTPDRKGQDSLDEISDYLVYRYGQRIYLTRQNIDSDKRGFDQYRVFLKLKNDTLTGYQITAKMPVEALPKVTKNAFDDGISFAEIPTSFLGTTDPSINQWLHDIRLHLGYQLVLQELSISSPLASGKNIHIHFAFLNLGASSPKRPVREMDKDVPSSYKAQITIKNSQGKTLALLRHTPSISTCNWDAKPVAWDEDLKMPVLKPGKYDVSLALIDEKTGHKLNFFNGLTAETDKVHEANGTAQLNEKSPKTSDKAPKISNDLPVGSLEITN